MSLTSYQAAPPRVLSISIETTKIKSKMRCETTITRSARMAPAVGFEPTTNRLTADRSTTELRWITQLKKREWIFSRTIRSRQLPIRKLTRGETHMASLLRYFRYDESVVFNISRAGDLR
jgi:hypothetical protein